MTCQLQVVSTERNIYDRNVRRYPCRGQISSSSANDDGDIYFESAMAMVQCTYIKSNMLYTYRYMIDGERVGETYVVVS